MGGAPSLASRPRRAPGARAAGLLLAALAAACAKQPAPEPPGIPETADALALGPPHADDRSAAVRLARERADLVLEVLSQRPLPIADGAVLAAMMEVPRHLFVSEDAREDAYVDAPAPIGEDEVTSQPYVVAAMTQLLALTGRERVLEIGTGTGYHAAILSRLAREVVTIERDPRLAARARELLAVWAASPVLSLVGDGRGGVPARGPFDAIVVTAALEHLPGALAGQLAPGGRMVLPLGRPGAQRLVQLTKTAEGIERKEHFKVRFGMLAGEDAGRARPR